MHCDHDGRPAASLPLRVWQPQSGADSMHAPVSMTFPSSGRPYVWIHTADCMMSRRSCLAYSSYALCLLLRLARHDWARGWLLHAHRSALRHRPYRYAPSSAASTLRMLWMRYLERHACRVGQCGGHNWRQAGMHTRKSGN